MAKTTYSTSSGFYRISPEVAEILKTGISPTTGYNFGSNIIPLGIPKDTPFVVEPEYFYPKKELQSVFANYFSMLPSISDILGRGITSPTSLPGYELLSKAAEEEANKLGAKFIGAGLGYTPQYVTGVRDIYGNMMRNVADIFLERQLELVKALTGLYQLPMQLAGLTISPEIYVPSPTTTKIVQEEKREATGAEWLMAAASVAPLLLKILGIPIP
jgi:hypothetical protein